MAGRIVDVALRYRSKTSSYKTRNVAFCPIKETLVIHKRTSKLPGTLSHASQTPARADQPPSRNQKAEEKNGPSENRGP